MFINPQPELSGAQPELSGLDKLVAQSITRQLTLRHEHSFDQIAFNHKAVNKSSYQENIHATKKIHPYVLLEAAKLETEHSWKVDMYFKESIFHQAVIGLACRQITRHVDFPSKILPMRLPPSGTSVCENTNQKILDLLSGSWDVWQLFILYSPGGKD